MSEAGRKSLHYNTAKMLGHVNFPVIAKKYLAQIYNIAPEYSQAVYDQTTFKFDRFDFQEVKDMAPEAPTWSKETKFRPSEGNRLVGYAPEKPFYHV